LLDRSRTSSAPWIFPVPAASGDNKIQKRKETSQMGNKSRILLVLFISFAMSWAVAQQQTPQDKSKRPSPPGTAECTINGKKVTIEYSRPFMKGRKIMGGLVPYGKVWRTGANEATAINTEADLDIGGAKVPAGKYTLYTLPSEGTWKLIINKQTGQWGTEYHPEQDLARVDMKSTPLAVPVEQFTISFDQKSNSSADLVLEWEKTRLSVPIKAQ
jgi:hypothetical protein